MIAAKIVYTDMEPFGFERGGMQTLGGSNLGVMHTAM